MKRKIRWNSKLVYGCRIFEYPLEGRWKYVERITKRGSFEATIEDIADILKSFEFIIQRDEAENEPPLNPVC